MKTAWSVLFAAALLLLPALALAGPPKPGKKCSVTTVGAEDGGWAGAGIAGLLLAGAAVRRICSGRRVAG